LEIDVEDILSLKFFVRVGRDHVQEWVGFLMGHSRLVFIVPVFQPGLTLEENVRNLRDASHIDQDKLGRHQRVKWCQRCFVYSGDDALLVLFGLEQNRKALVAHAQGVVEQYQQKGYVLWDGNKSLLVTADGQTELPAFTGSLDSLDELAGYLIPGFHITGQFDRSMSYVQMRDHLTRPKPEQGKT
jgi:hypothetical protein